MQEIVERGIPAGGDTIEVGRTHMNALDRPLISVHFPKASRSSFRVALEAAFGKSAMLGSYDCDPVDPANPMWINPDWFLRHRPRDVKPFAVVHGHLPIVKYDLLPSAYRVVMLREPVENLISIYYFWQHLIFYRATGACPIRACQGPTSVFA